MTICVNGEDRRLDEGLSLQGLLDDIGLNPAVTAVQHNEDIVSREDLITITLKNGDVVELIRIVGGG